MISALPSAQPLRTHPMSQGVFYPDLKVQTIVSRQQNVFSFEFLWEGGSGEILFPSPSPVPARRDGLWEHTCFEVFFAIPNSETYWEINASPSGDWNFYIFDGYRLNGRVETRIEAQHLRDLIFDEAGQTFRFTMDLSPLFPLALTPPPRLELGLTAVMEKKDHLKAYLALTHIDETIPNFHLRKSFLFSFE